MWRDQNSEEFNRLKLILKIRWDQENGFLTWRTFEEMMVNYPVDHVNLDN